MVDIVHYFLQLQYMEIVFFMKKMHIAQQT